jgi:hypothetical protein
MVSLAWLGGRWIPFQTMAKGVLELGLGALLLLVLILLIPRLIERFEQRPQVDQAGIAEVAVDPGNSL